MKRDVSDPWESDYVDEKMAKALAHPLRAEILAEVNRGIISPKLFAQRHALEVSNVSYHFRQLERYECVEVVEERKRRGSTEHFYKATRRALFDGRSWDNLPSSVKEVLSGAAFTDVLNAVSDAMATGTFDARGGRFFAWKTTLLDDQGWEEIADIHREAARETVAAAKRAKKRIGESDQPGVPSTYAFLFFESPWLNREPPEDPKVK